MHNTFSKYLLYWEQIGLLSIPVHIASNTLMPLLMPGNNSGNGYLSPASSPCTMFLPISSYSRSFCSSALSFIHIRCGREIELNQEAFFFFSFLLNHRLSKSFHVQKWETTSHRTAQHCMSAQASSVIALTALDCATQTQL